jgi:hypothetical protein
MILSLEEGFKRRLRAEFVRYAKRRGLRDGRAGAAAT